MRDEILIILIKENLNAATPNYTKYLLYVECKKS